MSTFTEKLRRIAQAAEDKKSSDIVALDFRKMEGAITDGFLICSGTSERQVRAISENICEEMKNAGSPPHHLEGTALCQWVLIDFGDIVVHVFLDHVRDQYRLEQLWNKAELMKLSHDEDGSSTR